RCSTRRFPRRITTSRSTIRRGSWRWLKRFWRRRCAEAHPTVGFELPLYRLYDRRFVGPDELDALFFRQTVPRNDLRLRGPGAVHALEERDGAPEVAA